MPSQQSSLFTTEPPKLPKPKTDADIINWIRLIRSRRVGPTTFLRLMHQYGDPLTALEALPEIARQAGVKTYTPFPITQAEREFQNGISVGAKPVCLGGESYPAALSTISDPPPVLWAMGDLKLLNRPTVAIVGARNASSIGGRMARKLSLETANHGYVIASGLARGVDTAAHLAALEQGTIAVLAGGVDCIYPKENTKLAEDIAQQGLLISESPCGQSPTARHFPARNRIISGLSRAVVVVEAAARSGSLITAAAALDQGREVMAVPGHPLDARASGCIFLIRDGATLVRSGDDIQAVLENLPKSQHNQPVPPPPSPLETEAPPARNLPTRIIDLLSPTPITEDQLIRELGVPPQILSPHLLDLELKGKLARHGGSMLALAV